MAETKLTSRLVLAFDASCVTCRQISLAVAGACDDKLEVLPLSHPDVQRWTGQASNTDPRNGPVLLRITGDDVRAWRGLGMVVPFARDLGPRTTARVLTALGHLQRESRDWLAIRGTGRIPRAPMPRARFLQLAAGVGVAVAVLGAGQKPVFAGDQASRVRRIADRLGHLPRSYDEMAELPAADRRVVFGALTPKLRSGMWVEHLTRYQAAHPELTHEQLAVLDQALALATVGAVFQSGAMENPAVDRQLQELRAMTIEAFGIAEAALVVATLGSPANTDPSGSTTTAALPLASGNLACGCSQESNWCDPGNCMNCTGCQGVPNQNGVCVKGTSDTGCGTFYNYRCDGMCWTDGCYPCL
ncbi:bacteriocin fulvocin C-related protein [Fodinicola acaciae]|uniref:bacteriocin fulvocin C-related protein n=1 Tax=Fodinicola acaciae TaxID=2681555 RepID=UPI0013D49977|nr:bacteriocin fulvocin C-related protein [Fodinicola acaciae]